MPKRKKGNNVNKLTDNENKNENEEEEDEVTGFAIVDGLYYEATSPNMLLLPFMSVTQDFMTVIPTLHGQYLQNYLNKKRDMAIYASNTDERDRTDPSCPISYPNKQALDNQEELKVLEMLQKLMKTFYK